MARRRTAWTHNGVTGTLGPGGSTNSVGSTPSAVGGLTIVRNLIDIWWMSNSVLAARTIGGPLTAVLAIYDVDITTGIPTLTNDAEVRYMWGHMGYVAEGLGGSGSGTQHRSYDISTMRKLDERGRQVLTADNGDGTITIRYGILWRTLWKLP